MLPTNMRGAAMLALIFGVASAGAFMVPTARMAAPARPAARVAAMPRIATVCPRMQDADASAEAAASEAAVARAYTLAPHHAAPVLLAELDRCTDHASCFASIGRLHACCAAFELLVALDTARCAAADDDNSDDKTDGVGAATQHPMLAAIPVFSNCMIRCFIDFQGCLVYNDTMCFFLVAN